VKTEGTLNTEDWGFQRNGQENQKRMAKDHSTINKGSTFERGKGKYSRRADVSI